MSVTFKSIEISLRILSRPGASLSQAYFESQVPKLLKWETEKKLKNETYMMYDIQLKYFLY